MIASRCPGPVIAGVLVTSGCDVVFGLQPHPGDASVVDAVDASVPDPRLCASDDFTTLDEWQKVDFNSQLDFAIAQSALEVRYATGNMVQTDFLASGAPIDFTLGQVEAELLAPPTASGTGTGLVLFAGSTPHYRIGVHAGASSVQLRIEAGAQPVRMTLFPPTTHRLRIRHDGTEIHLEAVDATGATLHHESTMPIDVQKLTQLVPVFDAHAETSRSASSVAVWDNYTFIGTSCP